MCSGWRAAAATVVPVHSDVVVIYLATPQVSLMSLSTVVPYKHPLGFASIATASGLVGGVGSAAGAIVTIVAVVLARVALSRAALALGLAVPAALLRCRPALTSALSVPSPATLHLPPPLHCSIGDCSWHVLPVLLNLSWWHVAVLTSSAPGALAWDGPPPLHPPGYTLWTVAAGRGGSRGVARSGHSSLSRAFILACSRRVENSWLVSRNCSSPTCCVCLLKLVLLSSA